MVQSSRSLVQYYS